MKKLMIAFAVAVVGLAVNAATVSWQAQCGWVSPDDNAALAGATFYLFDANAYALAAFTSDISTAGADVFSKALGNGTVSTDGEVSFYGSGLTYANDGTTDWAKAYGVLVVEMGGKDYYYMVGEADPVEVTSAILAGGMAGFMFRDQVTGEVGGSSWAPVGAIPEPTSGMLLLLGVAGLALRRRRA